MLSLVGAPTLPEACLELGRCGLDSRLKHSKYKTLWCVRLNSIPTCVLDWAGDSETVSYPFLVSLATEARSISSSATYPTSREV